MGAVKNRNVRSLPLVEKLKLYGIKCIVSYTFFQKE